jgi:hypothetical protein
MKVYRIEQRDEAGKIKPFCAGPYSSPYLFQHYQEMDEKRHPCPHEEGLKLGDAHVFGFPTIEHMWVWFTNGDAKTLHSWNFVVRVYEAENVQVSDTQCVMDSRFSVTLVETAELNDIFDF